MPCTEMAGVPDATEPEGVRVAAKLDVKDQSVVVLVVCPTAS